MIKLNRGLIALVLVLPALALAVAGCGGDKSSEDSGSGSTPPPAATTDGGGAGSVGGAKATNVSMTEYAFGPEAIEIAQGDTVNVSNDGGIVHNLTISDTELATATLGPGESEGLAIELDPGAYDFLCTIGSHADQGMVGTLTVK